MSVSLATRMESAYCLALLRAGNAVISELQSDVVVLPSEVHSRRQSLYRQAPISDRRGDRSAWARV
jgi:hypothetical protein